MIFINLISDVLYFNSRNFQWYCLFLSELTKEELLDIVRSNKIEDTTLKSEAGEGIIIKDISPVDVNVTSEVEFRKKNPFTNIKEN